MRIHPPSDSASFEWFTDRESEASAFKDSLARFRRILDADEPSPGNHNLLVFHGMGGIGKTSLSHRLERWVERKLPLASGWGPPPDTRVDATARLDLHGCGGRFDVLDLLLDIRRSLSITRRSWGSFDLALAAYWTARFPGRDLPAHGTLASLQEDISGFVGDILGLLQVPAAGSLAKGILRVSEHLASRRELHRQLHLVDGLGKFLEECWALPSASDPRVDIACRLADYLAWELTQDERTPMLVVFVDATERLKEDPRRVSERHLNELVARLPNVLFVFTGRDAIDWHAGHRADLRFYGTTRWPLLEVSNLDTNPRQHRVGNLSTHDRMSLLLAARRDENLPIADNVLLEIASSSEGLPQYLQLACQVSIAARDAGRTSVSLADVTGSLDSLVALVLEDVPSDEQRVIRAACLFRSFDASLVAHVAGTDIATAERAVRRPLIDEVKDPILPYRVHDEVRRAIREVNAQRSHGWSADDWAAACARGLQEARRRHDLGKAEGDHLSVLHALGVAITLVCENSVLPGASPSNNYDDWLSQAIVYAPSINGLMPYVPGSSRTTYGQRVLDFVSGKSMETPYPDRLRLLRSVFETDHPLSLPAGRHLHYALRNHGAWDAALSVCDELVERRPSELHRSQRPQTLALARRFSDALKELDASGLDGGYVPRVIEYAHGRPERYFREVDAKLTSLSAQGRSRELLEEHADLLLRRAIFKEVTHDEVESLRRQADAASHSIAQRTVMLVEILTRPMSEEDVRFGLDRIRLMEQGATGDLGFRYALGECVAAVRASDHKRLGRLVDDIEGRTLPRSRSWIVAEFLLDHAGFALEAVETQWQEPFEQVRSRWFDHFDRFYSRTRGPF